MSSLKKINEKNKINEKINKINDIYRIIKEKLQKLFPEIDIDLFEHQDYSITKLDELSYGKFIAYKLKQKLPWKFTDFDKIDEKDRVKIPFDLIFEDYGNFIDGLDKMNPDIFISNVNLDWKTLQLAKNDKSIKIPPNAPPLPPPSSLPNKSPIFFDGKRAEMKKQLSKKSSPKISKSKFSSKTLQEAKSKLKPKPPPYPPPQPKLPKRQSPKSKSKITAETLQTAKSKLKPKGPPYPPPQPKLPKRNSPKLKTTITEETLDEAKGKLKHSQIELKPYNPDYDLEMAFRKLENKSQLPTKAKSRENEDLSKYRFR